MLLLPGVICVVAAWAPRLGRFAGEGGMSLAMFMTLSLGPYALLALAAWGFRRSRRGSLAVLLVTAPAVALGVWAWWPPVPEKGWSFLLAGLISGFQLLLSTVAILWAGLWAHAEETPA
jgi:hypothetical protein